MLRAAESSKQVVGAVWNDDVPTPGLFGPDPPGWLPFDVYRESLDAYDYDDPEAGWQTVPSGRVLARRRRAAERRMRRRAGLRSFGDNEVDVGGGGTAEWLGSS